MNWQKLKLGDICTVVRNGASIKQIDSALGIPITRIETIADGCLNLHKLGYANIYDDTYRDYYLQKNDILMSHINSWEHLGKTAKVGTLTNPIIHGMNLLLIRTNSEMLNATYLNYYFKSNGFRARVDKIANQSVNQASFAVTKLKEIEIPLPPLDVQKKIADILDKADALRRKDAELIKKYDELAQSIFIDMFGDPVTNPKGWEKLPIHKIGTVKTGNTPSRANKKFYGNDIEWIKTDNIKMDSIYPTNASEYLSQDGLNVGRYVEQGSILVTCIAGSANTIGNVVITDRKVAFNQQINSLTPNDNHELLFVYFLFRNIKKYIQLSTTEGMKRIITKSSFEKLQLISPPLKLQTLFCHRIMTFINCKEKLSYPQSEQLFQSLMQRAFNGELVH